MQLRPHRDDDGPPLRRTGGAPVPQPIGAGVTVWERGEAGVDTYCIPALVVAKNGDLLAFAEARHGSRSYTGDIDLVMKRSSDGGATVEAAHALGRREEHVRQPCPVVVSSTGAILLLATRNLGTDHESQIIAGESEGTRTVWVLQSDDHGKTWSAPREVIDDQAAQWTRCDRPARGSSCGAASTGAGS